MRKVKNLFCILTLILAVEFALVLCTLSGIIKPLNYLNSDASNTTNTEQSLNSDETSSSNGANSNSSSSQLSEYSSVLNISLSGSYLDVYNEATKNLSNSSTDKNKKLVVKIGLQILQSNVIKYENELHFYSLSYSASGGTKAADFYNLKDCIDRINAGQKIYTDCFGFVRLAHSIACYSINPSNPSSVSSLSGLYGYKGAYSQASKYDSLNKLDAGTVIYDTLTGSNGNRHVAMFLYATGNTAVYMDQGGVFSGTFSSGNYIYSTAVSKPYKFNKFKNYC